MLKMGFLYVPLLQRFSPNFGKLNSDLCLSLAISKWRGDRSLTYLTHVECLRNAG